MDTMKAIATLFIILVQTVLLADLIHLVVAHIQLQIILHKLLQGGLTTEAHLDRITVVQTVEL